MEKSIVTTAEYQWFIKFGIDHTIVASRFFHGWAALHRTKTIEVFAYPKKQTVRARLYASRTELTQAWTIDGLRHFLQRKKRLHT